MRVPTGTGRLLIVVGRTATRKVTGTGGKRRSVSLQTALRRGRDSMARERSKSGGRGEAGSGIAERISLRRRAWIEGCLARR